MYNYAQNNFQIVAPDTMPSEQADPNHPDSSDASASDPVRYRLFYSAGWKVLFFSLGLGMLYTTYESALIVPLHMWGGHEATLFLSGIFSCYGFFFFFPTYQVTLTDAKIRMSFYISIGPLVLFRHERSAPWERVFSVNHIPFPLGWTFIRADHKPGPLWMKYVSVVIYVGMVHRRNAMRFIRKKVPNEVLDSEFKSTWGESLKEE